MLGVLSVLLLLIPSLLMLGQLVRYTEIPIATPYFASEGPKDHVIHCGRGVSFHVAIAYDGYYVRRGYEQWHRVGSRPGHDHRALTDAVLEHLRSFPHQSVAHITAQDDVPYQTLVATLDTVRGRDCQLAEALSGQGVPPECLLWRPIVEHVSPSDRVPEFRRRAARWPPAPPRMVTASDGGEV